jgi:NAD(P) transhydrogenase
VKYDAVVLGSGPAGEGAAMKLAKSGKRVAIVDIREQLGGNCTHVGTIPSKALRQTVSSIIRYQRDPMFKKVGEWKQFTMKQVLRNAHKVIQHKLIHIHVFMTVIISMFFMVAHISKIKIR